MTGKINGLKGFKDIRFNCSKCGGFIKRILPVNEHLKDELCDKCRSVHAPKEEEN